MNEIIVYVDGKRIIMWQFVYDLMMNCKGG